jgi:hypothetical protein
MSEDTDMRDWDLLDEELIRGAAELPPASRKLRRRVLRAAKKAERRGRTRRRILLAASLLLPLATLAGWLHGGADTSAPAASAAMNRTEDRSPEVMLPSATDAWGHVDASITERRKRSRTIRGSALY